MTTLFDVLADGLGRTYFDELEGQGVSVATANASVAASASAAGVVLGTANVTAAWGADAAPVGGILQGVANAQVSASAANDPDQTLVFISPAVATVEIFAFSSQANIPRARSTVIVNGSAVAAPQQAVANASVAISASAQALCFGVASASVVINATAEGVGLTDQYTSPATATMTWTAGASARTLGRANAGVSVGAIATGGITISVGVARATVSISAQAAESAGVIEFPRANASVTIGAKAAAKAIVSPSRHLYSVTGRSIDWKTITDAYNATEPPLPEYEFGFGKARRVFKQK